MIRCDFENAPEFLTEVPRWVLWKNEDGRKLPVQDGGRPASSTDPSTWRSYGDLVTILRRERDPEVFSRGGLGFVFDGSDDLIGIDLDGSINEAGQIAPWAMEIIAQAGGWVEVSPSGTGLKIFTRGNVPDWFVKGTSWTAPKWRDDEVKAPAIEVFNKGRFFTFSGHCIGFYPMDRAYVARALEFIRENFEADERTREREARSAVLRDVIAAGYRPGDVGSASKLRRAESYLRKIEPAVSGQRGHDTTFRAACSLVLGFDLSIDQAWPLLSAWNAGCVPPWSEADLRRKLEEADRQEGPRGELLIRDIARVEDTSPRITDQGETVDDRRRAMQSARSGIDRPGLYLDRSPTGAGKTFADLVAAGQHIANGGRALMILPTHANIAEAIEKAGEMRIDAASIPPRRVGPTATHPFSESVNCRNPKIAHAERVGIGAARSVCGGCPFRQECMTNPRGWFAQVEAAADVDLLLITHQRAAKNGIEHYVAGGDDGRRRDKVFIHEDPRQIFAPTVEITPAKLLKAIRVCDEAINRSGLLIPVPPGFDPGVVTDMIKSAAEFFEVCQKHLAGEELTGEQRLLINYGIGDLTTRPGAAWPWRYLVDVAMSVPGAVDLQILFSFAWGGMVGFSASLFESPATEIRPAVRFYATVSRRVVPEGLRILVGDSTSEPEILGACAGLSVTVISPPGRLRNAKPVSQVVRSSRLLEQVVREITPATSPRVALAAVYGVLMRHPEAKRVKIICPTGEGRAIFEAFSGLMQFPEVIPGRGQKVTRVGYYHSGEDRSDNSWFEDCDLLIVAGTPFVPKTAIAVSAFQAGLLAGDWKTGEVIVDQDRERILCRSVDEDGIPTTWETSQFADEAWRRIESATVDAAIHQAIGRGRPLLENGCAVVAISARPLGLDVVADLPAVGPEVLDLVRLIDRESLVAGNFFAPVALRTIVEAVQLLEGDDVSETAIRHRLEDAAAVGLVKSDPAGWIVSGGEGRRLVEGVEANQVKAIAQIVRVSVVARSAEIAERLDVSRRRVTEILPALISVGLIVSEGRRSGYSLAEF